ncbi:hypothetical protein Taro_003347, partial [Colocasia esculenta]|nr:hypothetical protein [Colocasia esculenta]
TQASVGSKTSLINKLRCLAAKHYKWNHDIDCARQEMIGEHRCDCIQEKHQDISAKDQEKHFKWSCVDSQEVPCRQIDHPEQNKLLEAQMEQ